jgi:hypothetical protein
MIEIHSYLSLESPWSSSRASHNLKVPQYLERDTPEHIEAMALAARGPN